MWLAWRPAFRKRQETSDYIALCQRKNIFKIQKEGSVLKVSPNQNQFYPSWQIEADYKIHEPAACEPVILILRRRSMSLRSSLATQQLDHEPLPKIKQKMHKYICMCVNIYKYTCIVMSLLISINSLAIVTTL